MIRATCSQLLDMLLRAEEIKARAQLLYFQSIVEYNKSIVHIHYLKGSLFDLNNVALGEGAWVDKAYWDAEQRSLERAAGLYFDYGYTRPGVVSQGPVESGGVTEGNVSDAAAAGRSGAPARLNEIPVPDDSLDRQTDSADDTSSASATGRPGSLPSRAVQTGRPVRQQPAPGVRQASAEVVDRQAADASVGKHGTESRGRCRAGRWAADLQTLQPSAAAVSAQSRGQVHPVATRESRGQRRPSASDSLADTLASRRDRGGREWPARLPRNQVELANLRHY